MSIQGVPVWESAGKFPKFTFHLIKSVAVSQTRTCRFSRISGGLSESTILIFLVIFALQCNIVILPSLHRYGEYWRPRSQSYCRYFGSYATRNLNVFQSIGCQLTVCESKRSHLVWLFSFILFRKVLFINFCRYWVFCTHILPGNLCSYCP